MVAMFLAQEKDEQKILVKLLRIRGYMPMAIMNEQTVKAKNSYAFNTHRRAMGMQTGAPDLLMLEPAPVNPTLNVIIEMKRAKHGKVSDAQATVHRRARDNGWVVIVAHGAQDGMRQLEELGYL